MRGGWWVGGEFRLFSIIEICGWYAHETFCYTIRMYQWTDSQGRTVETKTIADFARMTGIRYSNAKSLACGIQQTLRGWLSPKAQKKRRERFNTVLRNIRTGERVIVGAAITSLAKRIGVCENDLWKVVCGYGGKLAIKGWTLERSWGSAFGPLAGNIN
jgi:hypothetical protein